jgi:hypothetical protein
MLTTIITGIVITLIIVIAFVMHYMGDILSEFDGFFLPLTITLLIFLIGSAVYMGYAMPSTAHTTSLGDNDEDIKVYYDNPPSDTILDKLFAE